MHPRPLVLHVLPLDLSRGAQTYARELRSRLDGVDLRHRTLTLFRADDAALYADESLGVIPGRARAAGLDPSVIFKLRAFLRREQPAVVVAHGGEPLKYATLAGVGRRRLAYYKIGVGDARLRGVKRTMHVAFLRHAGLVAAVSQDAAIEAIALGARLDRVVVIPNGRDPDRFRPDPDRPRSPVPHLVYVAHLDPSKRPERFVELVRALRAGGIVVRATLAGGGPQLEAMRQAGAEVGVDVLGTVDDVPALLADADLFVFTGAPPEGMPGVLIEAGLTGLPVVTTAVPGATDVVEDGQTGFVVPVDNDGELLRAVLTLVSDEEQRLRFGRAARVRMIAAFSFASSAAQWRTALNRLIAEQCTSST